MAKKKEFKITNSYLDIACSVAKQQKWKVSILIDNPLPERMGKGKESYVGKVFGIDKDFIVLDLANNERLTKIILRKSLILSIWIYRE